jgi:hypothetical protein
MEKFYPMIIAVALLTCFLLYMEVKRANKARLPLRLLAILLLAASFLFLVVPVQVQSSKTIIPGKLLLLTPGYPESPKKNVRYFTLDSAVFRELGPTRVTYIPELGYYLRIHPEISGLQVSGNGLSAAELKQVGDRSYEFKPATAAGGVLSVSWPDKLPSSSLLQVEGRFENTKDTPVKLVLEGLGTRMDSVVISPKQKLSFKLSCRPKQVGRAIYHLLVNEGAEEVGREPIPFTVYEPVKLKVMVLAGAPDFEDKFMRNWLLENHYLAYFRTRISKDKFSVDAVNVPGSQVPAFSASMFAKYDLLIADDEELAALPGAMQSRLRAAVSSGTGLLVRLADDKPKSVFAKGFRVQNSNDSISSSVVAVISGEGMKLKPVPVNRQAYISPAAEQVPVIENFSGKILLSNTMLGRGRIAASTLHTTYNWILSGASADYGLYWSAVINKTSREAEKVLSWSVSPQLPAVGEELALSFQTQSDSSLPRVLLNQKAIAVQQHPMLPFFWQSLAWPERSGWNEFKIGDKPAEAFYVYGVRDWNSVKRQERIQRNQELALKNKKYAIEKEIRTEISVEAINRWWFFGVFLLAAAFLWFETKILQ